VSKSGGRQSLQIAFNVFNGGCGGCQYESYPYKAQLPVKIDGKYETWEFKSDKDVWKVIDLIIEETHQVNEDQGKDFDICSSVSSQIPFFACRNILLDKNIQKDIQRYLYCEKFNTPPYSGDYGDQPCLWIEKAFLIRKYLAKLESNEINKAKENGTRKN
tara:strand:+ start:166 stop:645 length:480 start_codon:yes stop_codon:yes gene_type:complete